MFTIGKIVNTQGVRGEMRIMPHTDDPSRFELLNELKLKSGSSYDVYEILGIRYHKNFVLVKLKGIDDMTAAEKLKGREIVIEDHEALPLDEDEYYIRDLFGVEVYENDVKIGEIKDVFPTGSNDVYVVKREGKRDLLLPAIKSCLLNIDIAARRCDVCIPGGLDD